MKRSLFNNLLMPAVILALLYSCAGAGNRADAAHQDTAGKKQDTTVKAAVGKGEPASAGQTNTTGQGKDTALRYKTEVRNNGPDQHRIDSIKAAKTKKKK
jgi:hypothetical protein